MIKTVVLSDLQGYKVDRKAWASTLAFLKDFKPDVIVLAGDIVDFDDISSYRKDPRGRVRLDRECAFVRNHILGGIEAATKGKPKLVYLEGNHEDRLHRYLCDKAPELYGAMLDLPQLLDFESYGVDFQGKKPYWVNKHLMVTHGHRVSKWSCYTAKVMLQEYKCSLIHGHTHRMGQYYEAGGQGREWVATENGTLMDLKQAGYVAGNPNWQQGFSVVYSYPNALFHIEQAKVIRGRVYYGGKVWG